MDKQKELHRKTVQQRQHTEQSSESFVYNPAYQRHIGKRTGNYYGRINPKQNFDGFPRFSEYQSHRNTETFSLARQSSIINSRSIQPTNKSNHPLELPPESQPFAAKQSPITNPMQFKVSSRQTQTGLPGFGDNVISSVKRRESFLRQSQIKSYKNLLDQLQADQFRQFIFNQQQIEHIIDSAKKQLQKQRGDKEESKGQPVKKLKKQRQSRRVSFKDQQPQKQYLMNFQRKSMRMQKNSNQIQTNTNKNDRQFENANSNSSNGDKNKSNSENNKTMNNNERNKEENKERIREKDNKNTKNRNTEKVKKQQQQKFQSDGRQQKEEQPQRENINDQYPHHRLDQIDRDTSNSTSNQYNSEGDYNYEQSISNKNENNNRKGKNKRKNRQQRVTDEPPVKLEKQKTKKIIGSSKRHQHYKQTKKQKNKRQRTKSQISSRANSHEQKVIKASSGHQIYTNQYIQQLTSDRNQQEDVRYPKRTRIKPVQFWQNQKVQYKAGRAVRIERANLNLKDLLQTYQNFQSTINLNFESHDIDIELRIPAKKQLTCKGIQNPYDQIQIQLIKQDKQQDTFKVYFDDGVRSQQFKPNTIILVQSYTYFQISNKSKFSIFLRMKLKLKTN